MSERTHVPCNGCSLCCRSLVLLLGDEGDDVQSYDHRIVELPGVGSAPVLRQRPNGECVYLEDGKCSIWERAPKVCRAFDCRRFYLNYSRQVRRAFLGRGSAYSKGIFNAGRSRVHTLWGAAR